MLKLSLTLARPFYLVTSVGRSPCGPSPNRVIQECRGFRSFCGGSRGNHDLDQLRRRHRGARRKRRHLASRPQSRRGSGSRAGSERLALQKGDRLDIEDPPASAVAVGGGHPVAARLVVAYSPATPAADAWRRRGRARTARRDAACDPTVSGRVEIGARKHPPSVGHVDLVGRPFGRGRPSAPARGRRRPRHLACVPLPSRSPSDRVTSGFVPALPPAGNSYVVDVEGAGCEST